MKKLMSIILALCMTLSLCVTTAWAGNVDTINDLQAGVSFAYDATAAGESVVIDGNGTTVTQWADAWVHQNTTIKNVVFANGACFNAAKNDITLTLEGCTFYACDQSKITATHKVNSGAGMCLNVEKSDKTGVSFVIKNCTFIGDGGAEVSRAGNKYDAEGNVIDSNKARGHAIALDAICGGGTGTLTSLLIENCEITNVRGNAIQLYGTTGEITIKNTKINSWGQNSATDKEDAAIRGDYTETGTRTITLADVYFGLAESSEAGSKPLTHVYVGDYENNTDRTQTAGTYFVTVSEDPVPPTAPDTEEPSAPAHTPIRRQNTAVTTTDTTTADTTKTDTVTSAKTFDAGVAVYGMMAVLSLTGSAWVVGKKRV